MSSNVRKGKIPHALSGVGPYLDDVYTMKGFFGDWVQMFRLRNLAHPVDWEDNDDLIYNGAATHALRPTDQDDAEGAPMPVMTGDGIVISISHRSEAMPFAEKDIDYHQIRFYHQGNFLLETELGELRVGPGDFVVIPKGIIYRETPEQSDDNVVVIFETAAVIRPTEEMFDKVGLISPYFVDHSLMELPEPVGESVDEETRVRTKVDGEYHIYTYDFDPCKDVVGYVGDPIVFKLNVWNVPGLGSSHGFLPPPLGAVLMGENKEFFFNVLHPKPFPNRPAPDGSFGAPAHMNDYDEVWFNHAADHAPETDAHMWRLPPTLPHPGLKRPPEYPPNPVEFIHEIKLNFDTQAKLSWTEEAKQAFLPDPQVAVYTSLYGTHIGIVPDEAKKFVKH
jgi:homogentisate 1,2-dioxygenase